MKKYILSVILLVSLCSFSDTIYVVHGITIDTELGNDYCRGFSDGYEDGFCYNKNGCIRPISPICPMITINEEDSYKGGYQRGFRLGLKKQKNN